MRFKEICSWPPHFTDSYRGFDRLPSGEDTLAWELKSSAKTRLEGGIVLETPQHSCHVVLHSGVYRDTVLGWLEGQIGKTLREIGEAELPAGLLKN